MALPANAGRRSGISSDLRVDLRSFLLLPLETPLPVESLPEIVQRNRKVRKSETGDLIGPIGGDPHLPGKSSRSLSRPE